MRRGEIARGTKSSNWGEKLSRDRDCEGGNKVRGLCQRNRAGATRFRGGGEGFELGGASSRGASKEFE